MQLNDEDDSLSGVMHGRFIGATYRFGQAVTKNPKFLWFEPSVTVFYSL